ncbi:hypothetical protein ACLMJK_006285 [Lecanora helva]
MPPIRRYLRITQYSVLEVRIYLDNPADAHRWLVSPRSPALPRVIEAVRPLVLPKLREENARAKKGKGKGKGWKDVVVQDDFEVAVFLTETSTRHSILRKEKAAKTEKGRLGTTNGRLTGTKDEPVEVSEEAPELLREESDQSRSPQLADIPAAGSEDAGGPRLPKEESEDELFVSDDSGSDQGGDRQRRNTQRAVGEQDQGDDDDKKKLALNTTYDGFSIYGRILCLVVKRKGTVKGKETTGGSGQAMMEEWIASTQMGQDQMMDD